MFTIYLYSCSIEPLKQTVEISIQNDLKILQACNWPVTKAYRSFQDHKTSYKTYSYSYIQPLISYSNQKYNYTYIAISFPAVTTYAS